MFLLSRLHAAGSGRHRRCSQVHWSNIQLTRIELSTPDATTEIVTSGKRKPRFHKLVSELVACGRDETRKRGRDEPEQRHLVDKRHKIYNTGQPLDVQKKRKLKSSAIEGSNRPRQSRQEPRSDERKENVRGEKSLNAQNVQQTRGERAGGSGQQTPVG